jgi:hypothetical protein
VASKRLTDSVPVALPTLLELDPPPPQPANIDIKKDKTIQIHNLNAFTLITSSFVALKNHHAHIGLNFKQKGPSNLADLIAKVNLLWH